MSDLNLEITSYMKDGGLVCVRINGKPYVYEDVSEYYYKRIKFLLGIDVPGEALKLLKQHKFTKNSNFTGHIMERMKGENHD